MATLESNNKFKDNLLASVSHELRTPLNGFKALIDSCLQDKEVPQEIKQIYIIPAARSSKLLNSIINDILDYSLLTRKRLQMRIQKVNILELFEECYQLMKNHYYKQSVNFYFKIDEHTPQYINTDSDRLMQVVLNFLSNAFKFTCQGSVIFEIKPHGENIRIIIKDTGIGMDNETMNKLTNILKNSLAGDKVDRSSTGVGLGLIVSQAIAFLLGPENSSGVYFDSELNSGSIFTFIIENKKKFICDGIGFDLYHIPPIKRLTQRDHLDVYPTIKITKEKSLTSEISLESPTRTCLIPFEKAQDSFSLSEKQIKPEYMNSYLPSYYSRKVINQSDRSQVLDHNENSKMIVTCPEILIVDDEPINILALELIFKQLNKPIDKAYGGQEALEIIKKRKKESTSVCPKTYKIIFMDLNMPLVDGYEATKRIKEKVSLGEIEDMIIVACTAYQEYEHKQRCLDVGMSEFINKPVTKLKILEILEKYNC